MKPKPSVCFVLTVNGSSDSFLINGALILLKSLALSNSTIPIVILYDELTPGQLALFRGYDVRKVNLPDYRMSHDSTLGRPDLNTSVFLRFEIQEITDYDIAIYLDCDVVVLDNVEEIFSFPGPICAREMTAYPIGTQFVSGNEILRRINPQFQASNKGTLNAGIVKYELEFLRSMNLKGHVGQFLQDHGRDEFVHNDQSLINLFYCKHPSAFSKLPLELNFMMYPDMFERKHEIRLNPRDLYAPYRDGKFAKVVHWTGPAKPWYENFRQYSEEERNMFCEKCYEQFVSFSELGL